MVKWQIVAHVRTARAIGVFYDRMFVVKAAENATPDQVKDAWFKTHGQGQKNNPQWELHHFVGDPERAKG